MQNDHLCFFNSFGIQRGEQACQYLEQATTKIIDIYKQKNFAQGTLPSSTKEFCSRNINQIESQRQYRRKNN